MSAVAQSRGDPTHDLYDLLGVGRSFTPMELKAAYFRLVREHTPEDSPDMFRLISEAYRTLSNPQSRAEYDAADPLPAVAEDLLTRIRVALSAEDETLARRLAARLYREHPDHEEARHRAGEVFARAGAPKSAARVFEALIAEYPDNPTYHKWLGVALGQLGRRKEAVERLEHSLRLNPRQPDAHLSLCDLLCEAELDQGALKVLDRGIHADGQVDLLDLPLLVRKLVILARLRDWDGLEATAEVLVTALPEGDQEARAYAAQELMSLARWFDEAGVPHLTKFAVDCARRAVPDDTDLKSLSDDLEPASQWYREAETLFDDPDVPQWIKALAVLWFDESLRERDRRQRPQQVTQHLAQRDVAAARNDLKRFQKRYRALVGEMGDLLWSVVNQAQKRRREQRTAWVLLGVLGAVFLLSFLVLYLIG